MVDILKYTKEQRGSRGRESELSEAPEDFSNLEILLR